MAVTWCQLDPTDKAVAFFRQKCKIVHPAKSRGFEVFNSTRAMQGGRRAFVAGRRVVHGSVTSQLVTVPVSPDMLSSRYHIDQTGIVAAKFQRALLLLIEAAEYAEQTTASPWEFAVEIKQLCRLGLCENDLRFLVRMKFVDHASEVTRAGNCSREFQPTGDSYFTSQTCFVLTPRGFATAVIIVNTPMEVSVARLMIPVSSNSELGSPQMPTWDAARHLLIFNGRIIKQFKWQAVNQETVLSVFQEEGWPARIDDPLAPMPTLDVKRRLSDTIKCLNRNQQHQLIRFHGDGTGQGVIWKAATAKISSSLK